VAYVVSSIGYGIAGPEASQLAAEGSQRDAQQLETNLLKSGALAGLQYEFIIREGNVWEQLEFIIQQKQIDAIVVGTHGREGPLAGWCSAPWLNRSFARRVVLS